jgi:hypothetical protein
MIESSQGVPKLISKKKATLKRTYCTSFPKYGLTSNYFQHESVYVLASILPLFVRSITFQELKHHTKVFVSKSMLICKMIEVSA